VLLELIDLKRVAPWLQDEVLLHSFELALPNLDNAQQIGFDDEGLVVRIGFKASSSRTFRRPRDPPPKGG
jgi:hypothetical protein